MYSFSFGKLEKHQPFPAGNPTFIGGHFLSMKTVQKCALLRLQRFGRLERMPEVGEAAPVFSLKDHTGSEALNHPVSDAFDVGKTLLIKHSCKTTQLRCSMCSVCSVFCLVFVVVHSRSRWRL